MKKLILFIVIFVTIILFSNSCIKDKFDLDRWDKEINYNGEFAVPLFYGDLSFAQVLDVVGENEYFIENADGVMSLVYKTSFTSRTVYEELNFPDFEYSNAIPAIDFQDIISETIVFNESYDISFANNSIDAELVSASFYEGNLSFNINSTISNQIDIKITFPSITKNGVPISFNFALGSEGSNFQTESLKDYTIDFTQTSANYNEIPVDVNITLQSTTAPTSGSVDFSMNISNLKYDHIVGYLGQHVMAYEDSDVKISFFNSEKINLSRYKFEKPKFSMFYENSYGIPSYFYFEALKAKFDNDDTNHDMLWMQDIPTTLDPYHIAYPTTLGNEAKDSLIISNDDIADFISNKPQVLDFKAAIVTNPEEKRHDNFISRYSEIKADIIVELPLWGYIHDLYAIDTIDIDLSNVFENKNPFKRALMRVEFNNGFPIGVLGQIFFADANYNILDAVFISENDKAQILPPAAVDSNGKVLTPGNKVIKVEYDKERLDRIKDAKYAICKVYANTTNSNENTAIKIYKDYKISFNVGAEVEFDISEPLDSISF